MKTTRPSHCPLANAQKNQTNKVHRCFFICTFSVCWRPGCTHGQPRGNIPWFFFNIPERTSWSVSPGCLKSLKTWMTGPTRNFKASSRRPSPFALWPPSKITVVPAFSIVSWGIPAKTFTAEGWRQYHCNNKHHQGQGNTECCYLLSEIFPHFPTTSWKGWYMSIMTIGNFYATCIRHPCLK